MVRWPVVLAALCVPVLALAEWEDGTLTHPRQLVAGPCVNVPWMPPPPLVPVKPVVQIVSGHPALAGLSLTDHADEAWPYTTACPIWAATLAVRSGTRPLLWRLSVGDGLSLHHAGLPEPTVLWAAGASNVLAGVVAFGDQSDPTTLHVYPLWATPGR